MSGILHFLNKIPIDWCSKKEASVETTTHRSKHFSARMHVDQIMDLMSILYYSSILVRSKSFMLRDSILVVDSSIMLHKKIHERHVALSFH